MRNSGHRKAGNYSGCFWLHVVRLSPVIGAGYSIGRSVSVISGLAVCSPSLHFSFCALKGFASLFKRFPFRVQKETETTEQDTGFILTGNFPRVASAWVQQVGHKAQHLCYISIFWSGVIISSGGNSDIA